MEGWIFGWIKGEWFFVWTIILEVWMEICDGELSEGAHLERFSLFWASFGK